MKFLCNNCGAPFDESHYQTYYEDVDNEGHYTAHVECTCPLCGSDNIESGVRPCVCGNPMREGEIVCASCKQKFLIRLNAFIDECTAEEVELLDRVSEGNSFADAKKWR